MLKLLKSVSMMLFLMGLSTGAAYAVSNTGTDDVRITQQSATCTGVVTDSTGETVIGASVVVKGTTNGTITGLNGDFTLNNVKKGDIIQISFVGYKTIEVAWDGKPIKVSMEDDSQTLQEVVVTALGIKREKKALGYAMQEVKGDALVAARETNLANALS
ncbi:carboxypeptidase-like regulatory domain-containing protein, partial [uncultured Bacteroides sp.]